MRSSSTGVCPNNMVHEACPLLLPLSPPLVQRVVLEVPFRTVIARTYQETDGPTFRRFLGNTGCTECPAGLVVSNRGDGLFFSR